MKFVIKENIKEYELKLLKNERSIRNSRSGSFFFCFIFLLLRGLEADIKMKMFPFHHYNLMLTFCFLLGIYYQAKLRHIESLKSNKIKDGS